MTGYMRFYAALIVSSPPPPSIGGWARGSQGSGGEREHPHGVHYGWAWLRRVLDMEPRPDITAACTVAFLEVF